MVLWGLFWNMDDAVVLGFLTQATKKWQCRDLQAMRMYNSQGSQDKWSVGAWGVLTARTANAFRHTATVSVSVTLWVHILPSCLFFLLASLDCWLYVFSFQLLQEHRLHCGVHWFYNTACTEESSSIEAFHGILVSHSQDGKMTR